MIFRNRVQRKERRLQEVREREARERRRSSAIATVLSDSDTVREERDDSSDPDFTVPAPSTSKTVNLTLPQNVVSHPKVLETSTRLKMSNTQVLMFTATLLKAGGASANDVKLSLETTRRMRTAGWNEAAKDIMEHFVKSVKNTPLALHWDEKIMEELKGEKSNRLAILVSGKNCVEGKLLATPAMEDGKGISMATALTDTLSDWSLQSGVTALVFDTCSSNTGAFSGAATHLETQLDKKLLWLACRHHVLQLYLAAAWKLVVPRTKSKDNQEFKNFQEVWKTIDTTKSFKVLKLRGKFLQSQAEETREALVQQLEKPPSMKAFLRDDYRESAEVNLLVLNYVPPRGIKWLRPGAYHHARFMAHTIYAPKMYAWSEQMGYDDDFLQNLEVFVCFVACLFAKHWLEATRGVDAPYNDLNFYKNVVQFAEDFPALSEKVLPVIQRHTWYLTQEVVIFALFSNKVDSDVKQKMAEKLCSLPKPGLYAQGKPVLPVLEPKTELVDLVGENSHFLFHLLGVDSGWLSAEVSLWEENQDYMTMKEFVTTVKVVNDPAERGVKLCQDFLTLLSRQSDVHGDILQVVEQHRTNVHGRNKGELFQNL